MSRRTLSHQQSIARNSGGKKRSVSGDGWYTYLPAVVPKSLSEWAAQTEKEWSGDDPSFKCTLLAGNMTTSTTHAWLKDFEKHRAETFVSAEGHRLFSRTVPKDPDRQSRRLRFLEENLFNGKSPEKTELESKNERKALNKELSRARKKVIGWAANWVLHKACTRDVRNHVQHVLTVAAGANSATKVLAKSYKDWTALRDALLADHGPEPNYIAFNAPAFAWEINSDPHKEDVSSVLMKVM